MKKELKVWIGHDGNIHWDNNPVSFIWCTTFKDFDVYNDKDACGACKWMVLE